MLAEVAQPNRGTNIARRGHGRGGLRGTVLRGLLPFALNQESGVR
jgi:hypothetical protein